LRKPCLLEVFSGLSFWGLVWRVLSRRSLGEGGPESDFLSCMGSIAGFGNLARVERCQILTALGLRVNRFFCRLVFYTVLVARCPYLEATCAEQLPATLGNPRLISSIAIWAAELFGWIKIFRWIPAPKSFFHDAPPV
jgi:hypothetical protein